MTQLEGAVGGATNDTVVAAEPTLEDRFAAITEHPEDEQKPAEEEAPAAPEPETELTPEDVPEAEAEQPPIAPPVSWTAEEKEEFSSLPRTLQETLTRREAEREKFVQSKAQEAKTVRTEVEHQALAAIQQANEAHVRQLMALLPQVPEEPSAYLQMQDPNQYAYQMETRRIALAQHANAQQVIEAVASQHQQIEATKQAEAAQQFRSTLEASFPEWLDPAKGPDLQKNLSATALALGYPADQLPHANARDILAIKQASDWKAKADKFDTLMASKMEKVREAQKMPAVSRPGTPAGKGALEGQRYEADRNAMRSGDRDAATRVFSRFV